MNDINIKEALSKKYEEIVKKWDFARLENDNFWVALYTKKIVISNFFYNKTEEEKFDKKKLSVLAGFIITILHKIVHCIVNYLPSYSQKYKDLCNPFIKTYKKNITVYDYIKTDTKYNEKKIYWIFWKKISRIIT